MAPRPTGFSSIIRAGTGDSCRRHRNSQNFPLDDVNRLPSPMRHYRNPSTNLPRRIGHAGLPKTHLQAPDSTSGSPPCESDGDPPSLGLRSGESAGVQRHLLRHPRVGWQFGLHLSCPCPGVQQLSAGDTLQSLERVQTVPAGKAPLHLRHSAYVGVGRSSPRHSGGNEGGPRASLSWWRASESRGSNSELPLKPITIPTLRADKIRKTSMFHLNKTGTNATFALWNHRYTG